MNYWLMKSEPDVYSWDDLVRDKKTVWEGVRNYQARNNLKAMKKGDLAFFYHSNEGKAIVGIAKIVKEFYPDPSDNEWSVVDKRLTDMALVRVSRLSVQPVKKEEFDMVLALSEGK
jgi:predicted RNA-binding protein with PUA-like domain